MLVYREHGELADDSCRGDPTSYLESFTTKISASPETGKQFSPGKSVRDRRQVYRSPTGHVMSILAKNADRTMPSHYLMTSHRRS